MRLGLLALLGALGAASAAQTWLQAAGFPDATELISERVGTSTYKRRHNPVCADSGKWKNSDATTKEAAVKAYKKAYNEFETKTEAAEKERSSLVKSKNQLDSRVVNLRLALSSLQAAFDLQQEQANSLLSQRNTAVRDARKLDSSSRANTAAVASLNGTIRALRDSITALTSEEARTEKTVTEEANSVIATIHEHGKVKTAAKGTFMTLDQAIDSRRGDVETLSSRVDSLAKAVEAIEGQHNDTQARVADVNARRTAIHEQRRAIEKEMVDLERAIAQQASVLDRANVAKRQAEGDASRASADSEAAAQKASSAERQVTMMQEEKQALDAALSESRTSMSMAVAGAKALAERRDDIQQRLEALSNASATLREKEAELLTAHEELKANATVVAEALAAIRGRLSAATMDVVATETEAARHRSRADAEAKLARVAGSAVTALKNRASDRRAQFIKAAAQGLLGDCDCTASDAACDGKCNALSGPSSDEPAAEEPATAADVLTAHDEEAPIGALDAKAMLATASAHAGYAQEIADGVPPPSHEDRDALAQAAQMIAATGQSLERAKDTVIRAAAAKGVEPSSEAAAADSMEGGPDLAAGAGAGKDSQEAKTEAEEMSTSHAVKLAEATADTASSLRSEAENAIDVAEGTAAANDELAKNAAEAAPAAAAAAETQAAEHREAEDSAPDAAGAAAVDSESAAGAGVAEPRFRQRSSLRGGAVLSAAASPAAKAAASPAAKADKADASPSASPAASPSPSSSPEPVDMTQYDWSAPCKSYSAASDRLNKAMADLTQATHLVKIAEVKYARTVQQRDAAKAERDTVRSTVDDLSERVSEQQEAVRKAKARVATLRSELERVQASIKEAMSGLDSGRARVQAMQFDKEALTERATAERKALGRISAQQQRTEALLEAEKAHLDQEREAAAAKEASLRSTLTALQEDFTAKQARLADLLSRQAAAAEGLALAEKAEDESKVAEEEDSKALDEASTLRDAKAAHAATLEHQIEEAKKAEERAKLAAATARAGVQAAAETVQHMKSEGRRVRGALQMAHAAMHGTSATQALASADGFGLEIAVRKLQDRLTGRSADVAALRERLANLAKETKAYKTSVETADAAIAQLNAEADVAEDRRVVAKTILKEQEANAKKAEQLKLATEQQLDELSAKRHMAPPGTMQELEESRTRREEIERAVGGSRAVGAADMVAKAFEVPAIPTEGGPSAEALAAVDPDVDEVLAEAAASEPAPSPAPVAEEPKSEAELAAEPIHPEESAADEASKSAAEDAAALDDVEKASEVKPEDLPGATGDAATDAILSGEPPKAEAVSSIEPPPAAGGPSDQQVAAPPMPGQSSAASADNANAEPAALPGLE
ncbi:hypothetical protein FNF31_04220 [Cafeteria roenbergensis]|uniref:Methyl-accepting transducer domain-containing protein n=1 Tax=Cafeteria roenbergensis TaxID=33653 RepID=A0A5A8E3S3_CAFRO|nr:hypothetical protein FNF31_04220 [Cafeteria roenbergensis]KAA0172139.1 hypothetical protein FNF28_00142 [Cafeteria roenbergensis]